MVRITFEIMNFSWSALHDIFGDGNPMIVFYGGALARALAKPKGGCHAICTVDWLESMGNE